MISRIMKYHAPEGFPLSPAFHATSEDRNFELALAISVLLHVLVMASLFYSNVHYNRKTQKNLEIIYQAQVIDLKPAKRAEVKSVRSVRAAKEFLALFLMALKFYVAHLLS